MRVHGSTLRLPLGDRTRYVTRLGLETGSNVKLLIANRGEIAIRIARAAAELEIPTVAVYSKDDERSLHVRKADEMVALEGSGAPAYLDVDAIVAAAQTSGCDALHPGYGFLSENAGFAARCEAAGIDFVGPRPDALALFGDKVRARQLALDHDVPVVAGLSSTVDVAAATAFFESLPAGAAMLFKAAGGGGGRGMRIVRSKDEIAAAHERARSEAQAAFGVADVFVEQFLADARHIEIQVAADGTGRYCHFGERDCTIQRRHQKLIEVAPAPALPDHLRSGMAEAALRLARAADYRSLGTFEFLLADGRFYFIEANARLQVEHTVTEEVTGVDLVQLQLRMACGESLDALGLAEPPQPRGHAVQVRVNMETAAADGTILPAGGQLTAFDPPTGPGIRTDTFGYAGYATSPNFDSLLAKVIVHSGASFVAAVRKAGRALSDFRIEGVRTNIPFLQAIMRRALASPAVHTRFVDDHMAALVEEANGADGESRYFSADLADGAAAGRAGAKLDSNDPLAVLQHGKTDGQPAAQARPDVAPAGQAAVLAPMQGTVVSIEATPGQDVLADTLLLVMEAMKMEHEIRAPVSGTLRQFTVAAGDTVWEGHALAFVEEKEVALDDEGAAEEVDLAHVRADLAEVHDRHAVTLDAARPDAVAKRRRTEQRTARENIDDLCDEGTFTEHGQLALTPGTGLPLEETIRKFPTDGMVTGLGAINGQLFGERASRCVVMSYDYTVLAGTQGAINHPKTDRMLELAEKWRIPMVLFAEGGGGRAGTGGRRQGPAPAPRPEPLAQPVRRFDGPSRPLDTPTFASMGRLSGLVPMVGITSRYCFAGNASLLGCCDVIIATKNSNIGMGGPALIEGGGLGVFRPEEIGPLDVQTASGVVDIAVEDEAEAVAAAKQYLSYFQGRLQKWECVDQRHLRNIVPENRLRIYKVRDVIHTLADTGSMLELRPKFGLGMVTAFIRIEGRAIGVVANNPEHLSGAIDSDGSDKAARFLQLCDAFDIPVLVLCDTPGMMVGPEVERTALVRHCSRLFVTGANLTVPHVTMVLRKAYGLGAQAMAGGSFKEPFAAVAWPTGEFGGMGLEGQVKLGYRNELAAMEDAQERIDRYDELVAAAYERGKALNAGMSFAVDDVIDPADSRRWISAAFDAVPPPLPKEGKKRRNIDTW